MTTKTCNITAREGADQLLSAADPIKDVRTDLDLLGFTTQNDNDAALLVYLACTARLFGMGQAILIVGSSGAGKSYLADQVLQCMPDDDQLDLAAASPKALLGYPTAPDGAVDLRNKVIRIDERKKRTEDEGWIRTFLSEGKATVSKLVGGNTREIRLVGCPAFLESTTQREIGEEDQSRRIVVDIPDCEERTFRSMEHMNALAARLELVPPEDLHLRHQQVQRQLPQDSKLEIPFAELILPDRAASNHYRRLLRQLHAITGAVALLRHRHGRFNGDTGLLTAQIEDYGVAQTLLAPVQQRLVSQLPANQRNALQTIDRELSRRPSCRAGFERSFTVEEAERWLGVNRRTVGRRLEPLIQDGIVSVSTPDGRNRAKVFTLPDGWATILDAPGTFPTEAEIRGAMKRNDMYR